jgi:ABC-type transport system involved in multi-copper enzyme maturation permease subunit
MKIVIKIWSLIALTFRESLAKKTFIVFFALSTLNLLFFLLALDVDVVDGAVAMIQIFGMDVQSNQPIDVQEMIIMIESFIAVFFAFVGGIFFSIFATASLFPTMLEKGSIEILLSKPLTRTQIFFGRYLGAQSIMVLNVVYLIGGSWLVLSWKTDFWYFPYLYSIPMVIAAFAFMYALMALVGLTTRSPGVSIMVAYAALLFSALFTPNKEKFYALLSNKIYYLLEGIYHTLPKIYDMGIMTFSLVNGKPFDGWMALWTSAIASFFMLFISIIVFSKKDY